MRSAKEPAFERHVRVMERTLCPRVHFKCVLVDGRLVYFGSANLMGLRIQEAVQAHIL